MKYSSLSRSKMLTQYPPFITDYMGRVYQRIAYVDKYGRLHYRYVLTVRSAIKSLFGF